MNVRKFWIENSTNQKYDLHSSVSFAAHPEGLGLEQEVSTIRLGDNEIVTYADYTFIPKTFEVMFFGTTEEVYANYFAFVNFLNHSPLRLYYQAPNSDTKYFCVVSLVSLQKSEQQEDNILHCPLTLKPLTFWQTNEENVIVTNKTEGIGKKYELKRPYYYATNSVSNIKILNYGMKAAPFKIIIKGEVTDPQYNLFDENGVKYGSGKFIGTFDYVEIDSEDAREQIILKKGDAVLPNPYNYQDLSIGQFENVDVTFLKLRPGTSLLSFILDEDFSGTVEIHWRNRYGSI